ncbi:MAG: hypothetical protein L0H59_12485 [Tomitella sp.]|nr:hypothetical protein [Tomitella sp.]
MRAEWLRFSGVADTLAHDVISSDGVAAQRTHRTRRRAVDRVRPRSEYRWGDVVDHLM